MNEKVVVVGDIEEGVEMVDLGDATVETRQPHDIMQINDSAMTFTYWG
jgi:hypothetical protein